MIQRPISSATKMLGRLNEYFCQNLYLEMGYIDDFDGREYTNGVLFGLTIAHTYQVSKYATVACLYSK